MQDIGASTDESQQKGMAIFVLKDNHLAKISGSALTLWMAAL